MTRRFHLQSLGCKANEYDGQMVFRALVDRGWTPVESGEQADLVVVNSCTVTDEADRQSRRSAARLGRRHPDARVVITGCGAEVAPDRMAESPGVHLVVGNQDKHRLAALIEGSLGSDQPPAVLGGAEPYPSIRARHEADRSWPEPAAAFEAPLSTGKRTRSYLKVQEGCDAFCTFCIIPHARGPARSLRPIALVQHVREVLAQGAEEVVLTGTALDAYGHDLGTEVALEDLVELILRETSVSRLRLGSLDPPAISPRLLKLMAEEPRLCPHLHLSLQSPHSDILRKMKRRYHQTDVDACLQRVHDLGQLLGTSRGLVGGVFVGMDVITGFPGETPEIFQWTVDHLSTLPWHRLHVFPYSEREGTAATRLPGTIPPEERKRRVRTLMDLSTRRLETHYQSILEANQPLEVLVEGPATRLAGVEDTPGLSGVTPNYLRVYAPCADPHPLKNQRVEVLPTEIHTDPRAGDVALMGTVVS